MTVQRRPIPPRRAMIRTAVATVAALTAFRDPISAAQASEEVLPAVVPLGLCGGAYCATYTIDGQGFRAVLDTGSPFLLVDGTCRNDDARRSPWGCYTGNGRSSGLSDTDELYGGEDVTVEWRRGGFAFDQLRVDGQPRSTLAVPDAIFGVVRGYVGKGGGGAVFLGLCKRRLPRIRPTLLEQTNIASLRFRFVQRRLDLSTSPLIAQGADAVRLIDLRRRGAPVFNYACRLTGLIVDGERIALDRQAVVVIDTGTTGISVDDRLLEGDDSLLPPQWRDARLELCTERGRTVTLESSIRRKRPRVAGVPAAPVLSTAEEYDEFPLIVSPIRVPWWDPDFGQLECADRSGYQCNGKPIGAKPSAPETFRQRLDGLGEAPYVLFVGLTFLWQRELTIDVDEGRMTIV